MPTTVDEKKAIIRDYLERMVFKRNLDIMGNYMASEVVDHSSAPGMPSGLEGAKIFLSMCYAAFPRSDYEIQHIIGDGDLVTVVFTIAGEHSGAPFFGTPPSGRPFKVQCIEVLRVPETKYVEHWGGMDFISLDRQLGLNLFGRPEDPADQAMRLAHQYVDGINEHDLEKVADAYAEDFVDHQVAPSSDFGTSKADLVRAHQMLDEAFPDVNFTIDNAVFEGDTLVIHIHAQGTHGGSYFGIPATGKKIKWTAIRILRVADGKFIEGTSELDRFGILQQMGIIPPTPTQDDTEGNKGVVRRLLVGLNAGNLDAYDEAMAPDVIVHWDSNPKPSKGTKSLKGMEYMLRASFPDLQITVDEIRAQEDQVGTRLRYRGTHSGPFMGAPATGKACVWSGAVIDRFEDGKIAEHWSNTDLVTLGQQVGLIPSF